MPKNAIMYKHSVPKLANHLIILLLIVTSSLTHATTFELFSETQESVGEVQTTMSKEEDTLLDIARKYDLGYHEITAANPNIDPWLPKPNSVIVLPTKFTLPSAPRTGIVLNIAKMRLFYYLPTKKGLTKVMTYPISVGKENADTPLGNTTIVAKERFPTWRPPESVLKEHEREADPLPSEIPPGPDNPLGKFVLRLGFSGYLIHGTNHPWGIGMRLSHGCIRLYPEDIANLYMYVPVGTPVTIISGD